MDWRDRYSTDCLLMGTEHRPLSDGNQLSPIDDIGFVTIGTTEEHF
ncbi:hypothetical protein CCACVL1_27729 [Corchorus capsularis]|uniref:Uncharacterized protein n=1 Tax=Corchorus capsularis TaxID=210143 RepID=A0A1R3G911_COCAP|nr:hypothetical protein CCACVL1_27729 [Corchorus capsularis]